jgi:hypothetical protein
VSATTPDSLESASLTEIAQGVHDARQAILEALASEPGREWRPRDLVAVAREHGLSNTIASIAYNNLVESGELVVDRDLQVRAAPRRRAS